MEFCKRIGFSLLRIWLGYMWLITGIGKLGADEWTGPKSGAEITRFFQEAIARSTGDHPAVLTWYAKAAESFGLPHAQVIAHALAYCEVFLGVALLFGVFTCFFATLGGLLNLAYLLGNRAELNPVMYAVAMAVVVSGSAASYYGVDRHSMPLLKDWVHGMIHSIRMLLARTARV